MIRRNTWKNRCFINTEDIHRLQSAWGSSHAAFGKNKTFTIDGNYVETNLTWSQLRGFFRHAFVILNPSEWVVDCMTTAERFKD